MHYESLKKQKNQPHWISSAFQCCNRNQQPTDPAYQNDFFEIALVSSIFLIFSKSFLTISVQKSRNYFLEKYSFITGFSDVFDLNSNILLVSIQF